MADGEADWENEDFEPTIVKKPILHTDRWEGEDEDEDVKDNWDDDEEEKDEKTEQITAVQPKKKKSLQQIIAEKEEKKRKELEEKMKILETDKKDLTPQEKLAQKLKQQKLQEEADLELAKETFGIDVNDSEESIDQMKPSSKDDFDTFRRLLVEKIQKYEESPHFISFLEDFSRDLCLNVNPDDIKKITSSLNALAHEKQKAQKAKAGKKKSSKKASLNIGKDDYAIIDYDEFEDCI